MVETWSLRASIWLPQPLAAVFPFFADPGNLQELTPTWLSFSIVEPRPQVMREGAEIDYRLRVRGIPLRWRSCIEAWDPPHRFVDAQVHGPYAVWNHEHRFEPARGGTRVLDHVQLRPRGGPLAPLLLALFVRRDLLAIFGYRQRRLAERFGGNPRGGLVDFSSDRRTTPPRATRR